MAIAVPQKKFYTYKPGTGGSQLKLAPGQTLGFQAGKGYYAKPAPAAPKPIPGRPTVPGMGPEGPNPGFAQNYDPNGQAPAPNYGADLAGMPDFTEAAGNYQYNLSMAQQQRRARMRQALIRLGFQPGSADARALEGLDPSTADLAAGNTDSVLAQLGLTRSKNRADLAAELAGRGMLDTGALRGGENMVQEGYNQGLLGATDQYLNEQNAALGDEANQIATGQSTFTAAKAAAANAAAMNRMFWPVAGSAEPGPTLDPGQGQRPDQTPVLAKPPKAVAAAPARYFTYKNQVKLRPGQTLKFTAGKGYYAG